MFLSGDLYWHDGLFIQPHHFQKFQRSIEEQFQHEHKQSCLYSYGLINCELDTVRLKEGYLEFSELSAYMPSGTYVDINTNAILKSLSLKEYMESSSNSCAVYLGIPIWSNKSANTATGESKWQIDRLYSVEEITWNDEDNCDNPVPILTRKIKLRLFFDDNNIEGYETIPLLKLEKPSSSKGGNKTKLNLSSDFIPPYYFISNCPELQRLFNDIIYKIISAAKELDQTIKNSEFFNDSPEKLSKAFLRLSSLNSHGIYLSKIITRKNIAPFDIYLKLATLASELSVIVPDFDPFKEIPDYNHENLFDCLTKLNSTIEKLLEYPAYVQLYRKEKFVSTERNLYELVLDENMSGEINDYYIGVFTHRPSTDIITLIEQGDSFKVLPPSLSKGKAIPGIKLEYQHMLPNGFPKANGLYYFRMITSNKDDLMWNKIMTERKIDASLTDEVSDLIKSIDMYVVD